MHFLTILQSCLSLYFIYRLLEKKMCRKEFIPFDISQVHKNELSFVHSFNRRRLKRNTFFFFFHSFYIYYTHTILSYFFSFSISHFPFQIFNKSLKLVFIKRKFSHVCESRKFILKDFLVFSLSIRRIENDKPLSNFHTLL